MDTSRRPIQLALVNDFAVVLAGIEAMLSSGGLDFRIERVTTDVSTLPGHLDVVLFDSYGAVDIAQRVRELVERTDAAVLIFGSTRPPSNVLDDRVRFLDKGASGPELVEAIHRVVDRVPQHVAVRRSDRPIGAWPGQDAGLTLRESEVVALIATGLTNADIADHLFLGVNTVKTHIRTAYRKVGVTSRSGAVIWALSHGFGSGGG